MRTLPRLLVTPIVTAALANRATASARSKRSRGSEAAITHCAQSTRLPWGIVCDG